MIIWGSKARKTIGQTGRFFCPTCQDERDYTLYKWQKYFTLYYIPLMPTEFLDSHLECGGCRGEFKPSLLEHTREQIVAALAPWSCASCKNVNASDKSQCVACGHARDPSAASEPAAATATPTANATATVVVPEASVLVNRWLGAWIDFAVLASFLLVPDYLLGNELYKKTMLVWLGLIVAYFPVMESLFGKTVGKFVTGIRVVTADGRHPSWWQSTIRTVFRLFEVNPLFLGGLPAGIAVLASSRKQRLGDMLATTYVLRDRDVASLRQRAA